MAIPTFWPSFPFHFRDYKKWSVLPHSLDAKSCLKLKKPVAKLLNVCILNKCGILFQEFLSVAHTHSRSKLVEVYTIDFLYTWISCQWTRKDKFSIWIFLYFYFLRNTLGVEIQVKERTEKLSSFRNITYTSWKICFENSFKYTVKLALKTTCQ